MKILDSNNKTCSANLLATPLATICTLLFFCAAQLALSEQQKSSVVDNQFEDQLNSLISTGNEVNKEDSASWLHWWTYDGISGPEYWSFNKQWLLCSVGRFQSPINIETDTLSFDHTLKPLAFDWRASVADSAKSSKLAADAKQQQESPRDRDKSRPSTTTNQLLPIKLVNAGRGIEVWFEFSATNGSSVEQHKSSHNNWELHLTSGPLSYSYKLFKLELHLATPATASDNSAPTAKKKHQQSISEHSINGKQFDGELQFHFYNLQHATSSQQALQMASSSVGANLFAAVSLLLLAGSASASANSDQQQQNSSSGASLNFLFDNLHKVAEKNSNLQLNIERKQIDQLLALSSREFVTYRGSLNKPPCVESVDWIVANKPAQIDSAHWSRLTQIVLGAGQDNVRPIQQTNGRQLRFRFDNLQEQNKFKHKERNWSFVSNQKCEFKLNSV